MLLMRISSVYPVLNTFIIGFYDFNEFAENNIKSSYIISVGFTIDEQEKTLIEGLLLKNIVDLFNFSTLMEKITKI